MSSRHSKSSRDRPSNHSKSSKTSKTKPSKSSKPEQHYYGVWEVQYTLALQDPDMPEGRLHHAIFVQVHSDGSGYIHHVTGDITSNGGMNYQKKQSRNPELSQTFFNKEFKGWTAKASYPNEWDTLLSGLPRPPQQKAFNPQRNRTEPFKERNGKNFVFYEDGEEREPLWKCTEWTDMYALPALIQCGLIMLDEELATEDASDDYDWIWDDQYGLLKRFDESTQQWIWGN